MPLLIHKRPDGTEKKLEFSTKPLIVGRLPESEISVRYSFISRVHCGFAYANNEFTLKDLGSTNGTYRNGARVFECALSSGDKIQVGNTTLVFEIDAKNNSATLRQIPQMGAAPLAAGGTASSRPDLKQVTVPVNPPAARAPSPTIKPK